MRYGVCFGMCVNVGDPGGLPAFPMVDISRSLVRAASKGSGGIENTIEPMHVDLYATQCFEIE